MLSSFTFCPLHFLPFFFFNFLSFLTNFSRFAQTVGYMQVNKLNSKFSSALRKKTGRKMKGPWEERQRQFSLLSSPIPASFLWFTCPFSEPQNLAVVFRIQGRGCCFIYSFFLNLDSVATPSCKLQFISWVQFGGGECTHPGAFQRAFGKVAVCVLLRCTVWTWFGIFPLSEQVKPRHCSAATPKRLCGGCRPGLSKECWTSITFAPGMSPRWLPWFIHSRK